ncbi:MAG: hypothetical protein K8I27_11685 [Planctomycetes bacterium]|nr:hypothetical protein [Planctomycetota bacterium]
MWLFTRYGFFSVTQPTKDNPTVKASELVQIRARMRMHLQALQARFPVGLAGEILESEETDYRYRLIVERHRFERVAAALVGELDYSNFKGACSRQSAWLGSGYSHALHEVWSIHHGLQQGAQSASAAKALPDASPNEAVEG